MRRALSSPWTITIVGTTIGTVLATWFLALHWSDVRPYLAPVWDYLTGTVQVHRGTVLVLVVVLFVFAGALAWAVGDSMLQFVESRLWRLTGRPIPIPQETLVVVPPFTVPPEAPVPVAVQFDPAAFELTPVRCRALLALSGRMEARTTLFQLHMLVTQDGLWFDPDTSNAQVQRDMEDAERAGIVRIDTVAGGDARYYSLTVPDGRDWVLENETHLKGAQHLGMKKRPSGPRYF